MINVKKGNAHSLGQSDIRGTQQPGILAGMICNVDTAGYVNPGVSYTAGAAAGLRGFAINTSAVGTYGGDGDVLESNKIALYTLDGNSIIETDQTDTVQDGVLSATTYPVGTAIYASSNAAGAGTGYGTVTKSSTNSASGSNGTIIGWVEGVRFLQNATPFPSGLSQTQNYTSATETAAIAAEGTTSNGQPTYTPSTKSATYKYQYNVPVLSIKLAATA